MQCDYYDAGECRSCTLMGTPYDAQLLAKEARARAVLAPVAPDVRWLESFRSPESAFRNKAKLVVAGPRDAPTVGILDGDGEGVDLRRCGLYEDRLSAAVQAVPGLITELGLVPYDVPSRTGELKHVILTCSPDGELMVRFVLRSEGQVGRVRRGLDLVRAALPGTRVVSVNLQPEHKAVLEGDTEIILTQDETLPMRLGAGAGAVTLHLRPQSFFQTNTLVAQGLYAQAAQWVAASSARTLWDLYCGVGGFALHCAQASLDAAGNPRDVLAVQDVLGVEVSTEAIESARRTAADLRADGTLVGAADFHVGDATPFALGHAGPAPDLVVVNPPRRGIGPELAGWLEQSDVAEVVYSSCNVDSLARDLAAMPSLRAVEARVFDMFPQTDHMEVMVHLRRQA